MKKLYALVTLLFLVGTTAHADSIGARGAVAQDHADEDFEVYEAFVVFDLPWVGERGAWRIQPQIEVTGGVMDAVGVSGFLGTLGPRIAFETDRVSLDIGGGVAVLGETEFGEQDFGGSSQFIAQVGLNFALTQRINAGVRYRHMSDAEIHDDGEDINLVLLEMSLDFNE